LPAEELESEVIFMDGIQFSEILKFSISALIALSLGCFFCYKYFKQSKNSSIPDLKFWNKIVVLFLIPLMSVITMSLLMPKAAEFQSRFGYVLFNIYSYTSIALWAYAVPAIVALICAGVIRNKSKVWHTLL
jgi:hypothetical protein